MNAMSLEKRMSEQKGDSEILNKIGQYMESFVQKRKNKQCYNVFQDKVLCIVQQLTNKKYLGVNIQAKSEIF